MPQLAGPDVQEVALPFPHNLSNRQLVQTMSNPSHGIARAKIRSAKSKTDKEAQTGAQFVSWFHIFLILKSASYHPRHTRAFSLICNCIWRDSAAKHDMGRPYGDDLRRKFLSAYDVGEETLEEFAERFLVSVGWAKKISAQRNRTGQAERVPHHAGRKRQAGPEAQQQVRDWIEAKPDLTLAEIQCKLRNEAAVR